MTTRSANLHQPPTVRRSISRMVAAALLNAVPSRLAISVRASQYARPRGSVRLVTDLRVERPPYAPRRKILRSIRFARSALKSVSAYDGSPPTRTTVMTLVCATAHWFANATTLLRASLAVAEPEGEAGQCGSLCDSDGKCSLSICALWGLESANIAGENACQVTLHPARHALCYGCPNYMNAEVRPDSD